MAKTLNTQVLIAGAGPTGLMAAVQLMRFGVDFIIIDKKSGPTAESRAIAVTARSLEIYGQAGLARHAIGNGKIITSFNLYTNGKRKAEVKIGEIGKGLSEFSYILAFEQSKNEEMLSDHIIRNGKTVHWEHEFLELTEHKSTIRALVRHKNEILHVTAEYLIGCDGAKSPLRHQLNFSFKGGTYKHKFFVADTLMRWDLGYDKLIITPGEKNFCAFIPLKNNRTYRIIGTLPKRYFDNEDISFCDIEDAVAATIGVPVNFESVNWFSVYKLHHRGVDHFSEGRVFLAGDSAHIHSPAGGQGMNTGLQDAYNLCWKLALVVKKQAKPSLLDTYNEERLPFARWLLRFTDRIFNLMTSGNRFIKLFRKYIALKIAGMGLASGSIRPFIFKTVSQTGYSYKGRHLSKNRSRQQLAFTAGDRLPYFPDDDIYPLFTAAAFHLLYIGDSPLDAAMHRKIEKLFPFAVMTVEQQLTGKWEKLGVKSTLFMLVRPDNYIAFICDVLDEAEVNSYLKRYFN
ncbi:MAG: FAD-dependent monooxygenase [Sinomicrobium sp.]|nr:FAD-dependent monooxygenase [Sinomicrobium sp.]